MARVVKGEQFFRSTKTPEPKAQRHVPSARYQLHIELATKRREFNLRVYQVRPEGDLEDCGIAALDIDDTIMLAVIDELLSSTVKLLNLRRGEA